jgi:hypothetical protein
MSEKETSLVLANRLLEMAHLDPDGDLCVLARQLLRREERLRRIDDIATNRPLLVNFPLVGKIARGEA